MRERILVSAIIIMTTLSCADNSSTKKENIPPPLPDVITKSDCATCHKVDSIVIGPSYMQIAERYPLTEETKNILTQSILNGSEGKWGQIPMISHPNISEQDAKAMAEYIMSLKK